MKKYLKIIWVSLGSVAIISIFLLSNQTPAADKDELSSLCNIQENPEDRCEGVHLGAEFNKKTNKCELVSWGCEPPPFVDIDTCKRKCEK